MLASVDFPAPFSPSKAWTSPSRASKSTESLARTPGKRLVIERMATAGAAPAVTFEFMRRLSAAFGVADHALDKPVHGEDLVEGHLGAGGHLDRTGLVVQRAGELVKRAVDQRILLGFDRRLRRGVHRSAIRGEVDKAVLEAAVVAAGLPRSTDGRLDAPELVRAPVVNGRGEPRVGRERACIRVVAGPLQARRLRGVTGRRAVLALAEHVDARRDQGLGRLLLLWRVKPGRGPDHLHRGARG